MAFVMCFIGVILFSIMMVWSFNASVEQARRALNITDIPWLDKTCGITNAADGSEDDEIHCFKQHGPASGGRLLLKQARENTEIDALIPEEIDIEEDAGNGYESDVSLEWNVM
uniref:Uncharacterized protein n=1 Tax=Ditylenchus dipsaci TaxID=166011 RepID=A0A915CLX6_9BILA